jgi:hypothetical protein
MPLAPFDNIRRYGQEFCIPHYTINGMGAGNSYFARIGALDHPHTDEEIAQVQDPPLIARLVQRAMIVPQSWVRSPLDVRYSLGGHSAQGKDD